MQKYPHIIEWYAEILKKNFFFFDVFISYEFFNLF